MHGVNPRSVQYAAVSATADGDNTIIAAPGAGKRILVLNSQLRFLGAGAYTLKSGAAGTSHLVETGAAVPGTRLTFRVKGGS